MSHSRMTLLVLAAGVAAPSFAQIPDRPPSGPPRSIVAVIRTPTVIAVAADTSAPYQRLVRARAVAESLGFAFVIRTPPLQQLVDQAHAAVYYVPQHLIAGYLIIAPSRRPDVIPSLVDADSLRIRLLAYWPVYGQGRPF